MGAPRCHDVTARLRGLGQHPVRVELLWRLAAARDDDRGNLPRHDESRDRSGIPLGPDHEAEQSVSPIYGMAKV